MLRRGITCLDVWAWKPESRARSRFHAFFIEENKKMLNNKINVSMKLTMKIKCVVLSLMCTLVLSSCCTLFCAKTEAPALTITSTPSNAYVYLNKKYVGKTPYNHFGDEVDVKKIAVKKPGYESQIIKPRKLNGWAYVNFFIPYNFILGYFLDRSQSKCWKYKNDVFHFNLKKNSGNPDSNSLGRPT
jgi:hypothetical protein